MPTRPCCLWLNAYGRPGGMAAGRGTSTVSGNSADAGRPAGQSRRRAVRTLATPCPRRCAGRDAEPPGRAVPRSRSNQHGRQWPQRFRRQPNPQPSQGAPRQHRTGSVCWVSWAAAARPAGPLQLVAALACQATAPATTNAPATIDVTISLRIRISPPNGFSYRLHPRKSYNDSPAKPDGSWIEPLLMANCGELAARTRPAHPPWLRPFDIARARVDVAGRLALQKRRHQDAGPGRRGGPRPIR
jgi:hypothetical protein